MTQHDEEFYIIDNRSFHKKLENVSTSVLHHLTMKQVHKLLDQPVDASISIFQNFTANKSGKCYYPFFLREPFSLKEVDFCSLIEPLHLQQLRDEKVIPLICMISESWKLFNLEPDRIFHNSPYFNIINWLEKYGIKEQNVVWLTCDRYLKTDKRVKAKFIHFDFFLEQQKVLKNKFLPLTDVKHRYISMAQGVPRHHRYAITYLLYKNDLLKYGAVSCVEYKNFSYITDTKTKTTDSYISKLKDFNESVFDSFKNILPLTIDNKSTHIQVPDPGQRSPINLHQDGRDESHLFKNVFLNVVNETHQQDELVFITEKTYRTINYCRPFVVNGGPGSLKYLKELGFQTFDKFWDESYDNELDDHERIYKILDIIKYICNLEEKQLDALYNGMVPILEHNYDTLKNYKQWYKLN